MRLFTLHKWIFCSLNAKYESVNVSSLTTVCVIEVGVSSYHSLITRYIVYDAGFVCTLCPLICVWVQVNRIICVDVTICCSVLSLLQAGETAIHIATRYCHWEILDELLSFITLNKSRFDASILVNLENNVSYHRYRGKYAHIISFFLLPCYMRRYSHSNRWQHDTCITHLYDQIKS